MAAFASTDQLHQIMLELWEAIKNDSDMSNKLITSKLISQFHYREPDGVISVDGSDGKVLKIYSGACNIKPVVEMFMSADMAHDFWTGKVNMPVAILTGKIAAKGPVNKALALLPVIKPAFDIYPDIYKKHTHKTPVSG